MEGAMSISAWEAEQAAQRAFSGELSATLPLGQKMVLWALFACAEGLDRSVVEPHVELAALAGLELSSYFTCLLKLKFSGLVMDDGQGFRIDHNAIGAAKAADTFPTKAAKRARGQSSGSAS
jgi:hypothetical protein